MSQKEPEALRVPLLDLALVSEGKKNERPSKKAAKAGNKNNDGDNRVPQEKNTTMETSQIIEAQKKQIADLTDAVNKLQQQQPAQQQLDPGMLMRFAQQLGISIPGAPAESVPPEHIAELRQVSAGVMARMKALGPMATSSMKKAMVANAFGVPSTYQPIPSGWETAGAAFGVGAGFTGGVLVAVGAAVATKLAFDALLGGGTTDSSAPTTTG